MRRSPWFSSLCAVLTFSSTQEALGLKLLEASTNVSSHGAFRVLASTSSNTTLHGASATEQAPVSFQSYYESYAGGRGMWKWNVALDAYQKHMGVFAARPSCSLMEIGVQSGGSIGMYHAVLPHCHYYGMDVNRNCANFQDATSTIFIGDQASIPAWSFFFANIVPKLDIVIDDGGHMAHQMTTTIGQVLPHMADGGFFVTEDIHGQNDDYDSKFFAPSAKVIALQAGQRRIASVHLYPFMLGVKIFSPLALPQGMPPVTHVVDTVEALVASLPQHLGGTVQLVNKAWGSFFAETTLKNFFTAFYGLHGGVVREEPLHCHDTTKSQCAMIVQNTGLQNLVKVVNIFSSSLTVEVHAAPPPIFAARKGSEWIPYVGP